MAPTHISNLFALAKGLRAAFAQNNNIKNVLQNNTHLLKYYYYSHAQDWKKLIRPNATHYQKTWLTTDNHTVEFQPVPHSPFGIAILTWLPGQMTEIHGHSENGCIMMPLRGNLTEERFITLESLPNKYLSVQKKILTPGQTAFINNEMGMHQVKNADPNIIAVSLHVYSPGP